MAVSRKFRGGSFFAEWNRSGRFPRRRIRKVGELASLLGGVRAFFLNEPVTVGFKKSGGAEHGEHSERRMSRYKFRNVLECCPRMEEALEGDAGTVGREELKTTQ